MITADNVLTFFGIVWILSWFAGCWVFHKQLFLTGLFSFGIAFLIFLASTDKEKKQKYCTRCGAKLED